MCGRVIQSSGPLRYAIVDGMNVRDSRVHNYPPRWNAAPSQDLLVIRRNHKTGEVSLDPLRWGLVPYWCEDPKGGRKPINAKCETVRDLPTTLVMPSTFPEAFGMVTAEALDDAERERASLALAKEAARRYSWENVAEGGIAAAQGRLDNLVTPPANILRAP